MAVLGTEHESPCENIVHQSRTDHECHLCRTLKAIKIARGRLSTEHESVNKRRMNVGKNLKVTEKSLSL